MSESGVANANTMDSDDRQRDLLPHHDTTAVDPRSESQGRWSYFASADFKETLACLFFAFLCVIIVVVPVDPRQRPIPYQLLNDGEYVLNLSYDEPFDGDTVPDSLAAVLAVVLPLLLQLGLSKYFILRGAAHATFCCYLIAFALTTLTTFAVKNYVGYLRPAFYNLCVPTEDYSDCTNDEENGT